MLQAWDGRDGFSSHFLHRRTLDWYMNIGSPFCLTSLVCLASFWDSLSRHNIKWTDWGAAQYLSWGFPCLMSNPKVRPFAACSAGLSVIPIMSTSVMERQGLSPLPVPFPNFDACPGVGPQIRASSAPPGLRMPFHRHLYIPAPLYWQWPGPSCRLVIHDWPTFGAASPSTRTFNPYNGFPWCSGKAVHCSPSSVAGCCPGNYDKFSNSHCQRSQHARVSAVRCRCPPSDGFHTSAWRSKAPSTCPGLPSSILQPASSHVIAFHWTFRSAGLCSASEHGKTDATAVSTAVSTGDGRSLGGLVSGQVRSGNIAGHAILSGHYAGLDSAAGEGPARCSSTSAVARSLCPIGYGPRCAAVAQSCWRPRGIKGWV